MDTLIHKMLEPVVIRVYGNFSGEKAHAMTIVKRKCISALIDLLQANIEIVKTVFFVYKAIQNSLVRGEIFDELAKKLPLRMGGQIQLQCHDEVYSLHVYQDGKSISHIDKPKAKRQSLNCSLSEISF